MFRLSIFLIFFSFLLFSCNNDDDSTPENEPANFYALAVGNTWEYEVSMYSLSQEEYILQDLIITNTITAETVIDGETYYTYTTTSEGTQECNLCVEDIGNDVVKDSLGYLIKDNGTILFSKNNTEDYQISSNTWGDVFGVLQEGEVDVETAAGEFVALQNDRYIILPNGELGEGRDSYLIADGVGMVVKTISLVSQATPLYRITLKSYTIAEN